MYKLLILLRELFFEPKYQHQSKDFKEGFKAVIKLIELNAFATGYANEYTLLKEEFEKYKQEKENTIRHLKAKALDFEKNNINLKACIKGERHNLYENKIKRVRESSRKLRKKIITTISESNLTDTEKVLKISLYLTTFNDVEEIVNEINQETI